MTILALIEAVERGDAGGVSAYHSSRVFPVGYAHIINAFGGDMNAALALHEALLPGWRLHHLGENSATSSGWFAYIRSDHSNGAAESHDQPLAARALLLAILRAVEAEGQP